MPQYYGFAHYLKCHLYVQQLHVDRYARTGKTSRSITKQSAEVTNLDTHTVRHFLHVFTLRVNILLHKYVGLQVESHMFDNFLRIEIVEFFIATTHITGHAMSFFVMFHKRSKVESRFMANAAFHFVK